MNNMENKLTIKEWINNNIKSTGAKNFFDCINNAWDNYANIIKEMILSEIFTYIKPNKIETIKDLATLLNNNYSGYELKNEYNINVEEICKKNKWIICFPYSDDNIEIRGYIYDELGCWNGGSFKICKKGDFYPDDEEENTYHKSDRDIFINCNDENERDLVVIWDDDKYDVETHKKYIWNYVVKNPNLPHEYFNILDEDCEEDEIWAKCCIIDCSKIL